MDKEKKLLILMWMSMLIWGISWSSAKVLSAYGQAANLAWIRFFIVFITLGILLKALSFPFKVPRQGILTIFGASIALVSYSLLFFTALQHGHSGAGGVLVTSTIPLFSYLLHWFIEKKKVRNHELKGLFLGILACAFLIHIWSPVPGFFDLATTLFLISALFWAILTQLSSQAHRYCHPIVFNFWTHGITVFILGLTISFEETVRILSSGDFLFWSNLLYFSIINSAGATSVYLFASSKIGASKASSYIYLVPLGALLSSWIFLGETPLWYTVIGGILGVLAVLQLQKKTN